MEQATVTTNRRLQRGDGPLGGVAAGMADYFAIDPTIIRLGLVATTLLGGPTVPVVYLAAWLIIPQEETGPPAPAAPAPWTDATPPPPPPAPPAPAPADGTDLAGTPAVAIADDEAPVQDDSIRSDEATESQATEDEATEDEAGEGTAAEDEDDR